MPSEEIQTERPILVPARVLRLLQALAVGLSLATVLLFLFTAHRRLHYPFDLEWVEDGNLQELWRVIRHQPLYLPPGIHYVPYLYAPLFFWLSSLVAKFTGVGFAAMRLLSTLGALGTLGGLFALVYLEFPASAAPGSRRSPRLLAACVAVGFFMCAYPQSGSFFDLGRVDMVCLCFTMLALLAGRRGFPVLAAVLWVLAFQTKQGVLPVALLALCFEWQKPRRIVLGLGTFAMLAGASVAWLNHGSGGWYWRYVFGMAKGFPLLARSIGLFLPRILFVPFGIALLLALAALLFTPPDWRSRASAFYLCSGLGMVAFTWYIYAHLGASGNSVLPTYLYISMTGGLALGRMLDRLERSGLPLASAAQATLLCACLVQMSMHLYTPNMFYPNSDERREVAAVVDDLRRIPGDVLVMDHAEYAVMAGHAEYANGEAAIAMILVHNGQISQVLHQSYADAIHQRRLSAIALDEEPAGDYEASIWAPADMAAYYPVKVHLLHLGGFYMTPRPVLLLMPCPDAAHADPAKLFPDLLVDEDACARQ